jgi:GT2 family glycosyltransferase
MITVILVNYNVRTFLEQALQSVKRSTDVKYEVIVVDNHSSDDSCEVIKSKYPWVTLIENKENVGFSKANNQGIQQAKGDFILLLNPDTILAEDTLRICEDFMKNNPDAGALGVRMVDGTGKFLPESKRGLPTPLVAFYKIFGLSALFPHSKKFGAYHLKYLSPFENHAVDVLSGAFMFMRKEALNKAGLLDETFFMYGEDIDLSYRIQLAGYKNYYLASTEIVHYKGESTKKNSIRYVKVFYQAMLIFFTKHFGLKVTFLQRMIITLAVYLRAALALLKRFIQFAIPLVLDFVTLYAVYFGVTRYWEEYNKWVEGGAYPSHYFTLHLSVYAILLIIGQYLGGNYKRYPAVAHGWKSALMGGALLLLFYALLPESERYSRAILVLGAFIGLGLLSFLKHLLFVGKKGAIFKKNTDTIRVAVVGNTLAFEQIAQRYTQQPANKLLVGRIDPEASKVPHDAIASLDGLANALQLFGIDELVFDAKSLGNKQVISLLQLPALQKIKIGILPPDLPFVIKSYHRNTNGEVESEAQKTGLFWVAERRKKRLVDLLLCGLLLPKLLSAKKLAYSDWLSVLLGKKTWIGVANESQIVGKPYLLSLEQLTKNQGLSSFALTQQYLYHYQWYTDLILTLHFYWKRRD